MRIVSAVLLLLTAAFPGWALRLEPLPEVAARPAAGPALDRTGLADLSLLLSGVAPASVPAYRAVLDRWSAEFLASPAAALAAPARAEALLQFLHRRLKGYSTYQTRLDVLVDRGTFNCVSSALAYMILGRDAGLDVQAVATTDHAFALVRLPDRDVDVETTSPYGFDPGTKTEFTNSFGQTGFVYVPPGNYAQRRSIGDRQLLGLLVQNRMADAQRAGQPEEGVGPAVDRWVLEASPEAKASLVDGFRNYASWLNGRREYAKGLELIDRMVAWTGPVDEARQIAWAFLNNQVNQLLDRKDFAGAQALTLAWKNRGFLNDTDLARTLGVIADQQLADQVRSRPAAEAARAVETAFSTGAVTAARRQELLTFAYGQEVQRLAASAGPRKAWDYLSSLPDEVRALPSLVQARQVYAYNWSVEVHNRFVRDWQAGRHAEARKALAEALVLLPESSLLLRDKVVAEGP